MVIKTRFVRPLGGSVLPAKYVVVPHPASTIAATRHPAALYQRLLFFKIASLETGAHKPGIFAPPLPQHGQNKWRLPQIRTVQNRLILDWFCLAFDSRSITKQPAHSIECAALPFQPPLVAIGRTIRYGPATRAIA